MDAMEGLRRTRRLRLAACVWRAIRASKRSLSLVWQGADGPSVLRQGLLRSAANRPFEVARGTLGWYLRSHRLEHPFDLLGGYASIEHI